MPTNYLHRPEQIVAKIQQTFKKKETVGTCVLFTSTIPGAKKSDVLGVIAASDIEARTQLFPEITALVASSDDPMAVQRSRSYRVCEFCCDTIQPQQKGTVSCEKCTATYCNESCGFRASVSYHRALCGKAFGWIYDVDRTDKPSRGKPVNQEQAVEGASWLRGIALCVQEDCHPLEHPPIARVTSQYKGKIPQEWSLSGDVERAHIILQQLEIDI